MIPLSNSSVSRRIDEMTNDVEKQLVAQLQAKKVVLQSMYLLHAKMQPF
jgi:hypothetical protein